MSKGLYIYSWNVGDSVRELANALECRRIKQENSNFKGRADKTIINWGSSAGTPELEKCRVLNLPSIVERVSNKLSFFRQFNDEARIVPWTTTTEGVKSWLQDGSTVCARQKLTGHSGEGLVLFSPLDPVPKAQLYTLYVKKRDEYRIHVFKGEVISIQRKAIRSRDEGDESSGEVDHRVRNLKNGYVFVRNNVDPPKDVLVQAIAAVQHTKLDFGAVDVIWNERKQQAFVLEINTAPGLEGQTITDYVNAIKGFLS